MSGDVPKTVFVPVKYNLVTEESERIAVDHVTNTTSHNPGQSDCKSAWKLDIQK